MTARRVLALILIATAIPVFLAARPNSIAADSPKQKKSAVFQQQVEKLLKSLDDDSRTVRTRAEQELLRLGPDILPLLPPPELTPTVSVRAAVRRIRIKLEQRKARQSVLPSRVTLMGKFPLDHVLEQIQKQTGNSIDVSSLPRDVLEAAVTIDYQRQPFWRAMDDLISRAKLRYNFHADADRLKLEAHSADGKTDNNTVAYSGAYRIQAKPPRVRPIFGDDAHRLLRVPVLLSVEPRLRPLFLKYAAVDMSATTAAKLPLQPLNPEARYELPLGTGGKQLRRELNFKVPASSVPSHIHLHGKFVMQTAAGIERIAFTGLPKAQGIARRRGGVTVVLQRVAFFKGPKGEQQARLRVAVSYDFGGPAFESHRTWVFHNQVYLQAKDGGRISYAGYDTARQADGAVVVEYRFASLKDKPANYRLIYEAPTLIINVPIEFRFSKLTIEQPAQKGERNGRS